MQTVSLISLRLIESAFFYFSNQQELMGYVAQEDSFIGVICTGGAGQPSVLYSFYCLYMRLPCRFA